MYYLPCLIFFSSLGFGDQPQVPMLSWQALTDGYRLSPHLSPTLFLTQSCFLGKAHLVSVNQKEYGVEHSFPNQVFNGRCHDSFLHCTCLIWSGSGGLEVWGSGGLGVRTASAEGHRRSQKPAPTDWTFRKKRGKPFTEAAVCSGITPHSRGTTPIPAIIPHMNCLTLEEAKRGEVAGVTFN